MRKCLPCDSDRAATDVAVAAECLITPVPRTAGRAATVLALAPFWVPGPPFAAARPGMPRLIVAPRGFSSPLHWRRVGAGSVWRSRPGRIRFRVIPATLRSSTTTSRTCPQAAGCLVWLPYVVRRSGTVRSACHRPAPGCPAVPAAAWVSRPRQPRYRSPARAGPHPARRPRPLAPAAHGEHDGGPGNRGPGAPPDTATGRRPLRDRDWRAAPATGYPSHAGRLLRPRPQHHTTALSTRRRPPRSTSPARRHPAPARASPTTPTQQPAGARPGASR